MGERQPATCMALVHKTSSAPSGENDALNTTAANRKAKVFIPFISPWSTSLLQ